MAAFDLDVYFTGLCGYRPDVSISGTPTSMQVLLPLADEGTISGSTVIEAHYPAVLLAPGHIDTTSLPADEWMKRIIALPIAGHDVTFKVTGGKALTIDKTPIDPNKPQDPKSFYWTLPMTDILPALSKVDPVCLDLKAPVGVAARINFKEGHLSCADTEHLKSSFRIPQARDNALNSPKGRPLANRAHLSFTGITAAALELTPFDGASSSIALKTTTGKIKMIIGNFCGKDLISELTGKVNPSLAQSDDDFRWMYRLAVPNLPPDFLALLPCPQQVGGTGGGGGMGQPRCFGGLFEP